MSDYMGRPDHWTAITVYNLLHKKSWDVKWQLGINEYERNPNSEKARRFNSWWAKDMEETRKEQEELKGKKGFN